MEIKLNIGCGPNGQFPEYINIDNSMSVIIDRFKLIKWILFRSGKMTAEQYNSSWAGVIRCDASKHLPFHQKTVSKIYSSHFLEHIPQEKGVRVLEECYRVLKDDGVIRFVVPDLFYYAKIYLKSTELLLNEEKMPHNRTIHDSFLNTIYGSYLKKTRYGLEHCYMYDLPTLVSILKDIGFKNIQRCNFKEGKDLELASKDNRPNDSLHLEIRKI